jgi:hypothetical protein
MVIPQKEDQIEEQLKSVMKTCWKSQAQSGDARKIDQRTLASVERLSTSLNSVKKYILQIATTEAARPRTAMRKRLDVHSVNAVSLVAN